MSETIFVKKSKGLLNLLEKLKKNIIITTTSFLIENMLRAYAHVMHKYRIIKYSIQYFISHIHFYI